MLSVLLASVVPCQKFFKKQQPVRLRNTESYLFLHMEHFQGPVINRILHKHGRLPMVVELVLRVRKELAHVKLMRHGIAVMMVDVSLRTFELSLDDEVQVGQLLVLLR